MLLYILLGCVLALGFHLGRIWICKADLLISFSSTTIEEALVNKIPVALYGGKGRYCHIESSISNFGNNLNKPLIFIKTKENLLNYMEKLNNSSNTFMVNDNDSTFNELVDIVAAIAGKKIEKNHDVSQPQGVRGRNSDNNLLRKVVNWEPSITLDDGLKQTYFWIEKQVQKNS